MTWEEKLAEVEYYAGKRAKEEERKHNIINSIKKLDKKDTTKRK